MLLYHKPLLWSVICSASCFRTVISFVNCESIRDSFPHNAQLLQQQVDFPDITVLSLLVELKVFSR